MQSVQRIRLPSVNDIFPKVENQLIMNQQCYNVQANMIQSSPIEMHQNYSLQQPQVTYTLAPQVSANLPQISQQQPATAGPIAQPIPYYPQNSIPIQHHPHQQLPPASITPSNSPINYINTGNNMGNTPPPYNYHQPRHNGVIMGSIINSQNKYKISKNSVTRQSNAWSANDDELLKYLKEVKNLGWREISMYFENRTANGCQFRWRRIVALSKQQENYQHTIKRTDLQNTESRSNSLESLLN